MYHYVERHTTSGVYREIVYAKKTEIGRFALNTHSVTDASIYVEPEHRGKGIARKLIAKMKTILMKEGSYDKTLYVYIDTDASSGFWDHIGFLPNPNIDNPIVPEYGYEKRICMKDF
jgi:ribosomal protein S18 acetylase RimI-like enzyme